MVLTFSLSLAGSHVKLFYVFLRDSQTTIMYHLFTNFVWVWGQKISESHVFS